MKAIPALLARNWRLVLLAIVSYGALVVGVYSLGPFMHSILVLLYAAFYFAAGVALVGSIAAWFGYDLDTFLGPGYVATTEPRTSDLQGAAGERPKEEWEVTSPAECMAGPIAVAIVNILALPLADHWTAGFVSAGVLALSCILAFTLQRFRWPRFLLPAEYRKPTSA